MPFHGVSFLPPELVEHVFSFIDDATTFAHTQRVCHTWKTLCCNVVRMETTVGDQCVCRHDWDGAVRAYDGVLRKRPSFVPAILGLRYALQWKGSHWNWVCALTERAKDAEGVETKAYWTDVPLHWFLRGEQLRCVRDGSCTAQALAWYRLATDAGHAGAACSLGDVLRDRCMRRSVYAAWEEEDDEDDIDRMSRQVVVLYEASAALGYPPALHRLAWCLVEGRGVSRDISHGAALFERSATLGYAPAQIVMGQACAHGTFAGVPLDEERAMTWRAKARAQGFTSYVED